MSAYDDLRAELNNTKQVNNASERERIVGTVVAKALVDIAESLSALLAVVSTPLDEVTSTPEPAAVKPEQAPRPLEVGDVVTVEASHLVGVVVELGETEGELAATVKWPDGTTSKLWVSVLKRVEHDDDGLDDDFDAPTQPTEAELEDMPADAFAALKKGKSHGKA